MNKELATFIKELKKDFKPKKQDPNKPTRCWSEKDVLNGKIVDAFVIILRTQGCSWAQKTGCSMCGYFNDSAWEKISDKDLLKQFENAMTASNNTYNNMKSFVERGEIIEEF